MSERFNGKLPLPMLLALERNLYGRWKAYVSLEVRIVNGKCLSYKIKVIERSFIDKGYDNCIGDGGFKGKIPDEDIIRFEHYLHNISYGKGKLTFFIRGGCIEQSDIARVWVA